MSYKIATVLGIPIKLHISLIILAALQMQAFGLIDGLQVGVGLLVSIVLHELGHSVVAILKNCRVREITLMFMGGAAVMERMPRKPLDEFLMAIAGPAVSLLLGVGLFDAGLRLPMLPAEFPFYGGRGTIHYLNILQWLGVINFMLLVFNLLPVFPMDGGRILRAALTPKFGRLRATRIAARLGQFVAVLFVLGGLFGVERVWTLVVIGVFVFVVAGNEYRMVLHEEMNRRDPTEPFGFGSEPGPADNEVIISPPPYANGERPTRTEIHTEDGGGPFRR